MTTTPSRRHLAVGGVAAGLAGIAVGRLATSVLGVEAPPVLAVGEAIIRITPGALAEALIQLVGQYDKPLLIAGTVLAVLGLAALAGVQSARRPRLSVAIFAAMAVIGAVAVLSRPGSRPLDLLPTLLGAATWMVAISFLRPRPESAPPAERSAAAQTRRGFLIRAGAVAAGAVVVGVAGQVLGGARRAVAEARRTLNLAVSGGTPPAGATLEDVDLEPWRTPNERFYRIDTALVVPAIEPDAWRLRIHGMVENEITLTYADLLDRKLTEAWVTLCCVSNPVGGDLIGNAWWSGVRIADILAEAGVDPEANAVLQTSEDGWTCGTPLPTLTDDRAAMLAIAMNGEPLPVEHGFPVRMVVPGLYGYVSATKWLVDIEVTRFDQISAFWTDRGWAEQGEIKTMSRIGTPADGAQVPAGIRHVGGYAWSQHVGIAKVEFQLDGGAWQLAELGAVPGDDTWVQWSGEVELAPGRHTLVARATDESGHTQTSVRQGVLPDGATGWPTAVFTAE